VDWTDLARDRNQWQVHVCAAMTFPFRLTAGTVPNRTPGGLSFRYVFIYHISWNRPELPSRCDLLLKTSNKLNC
jgi:hypothetical protein